MPASFVEVIDGLVDLVVRYRPPDPEPAPKPPPGDTQGDLGDPSGAQPAAAAGAAEAAVGVPGIITCVCGHCVDLKICLGLCACMVPGQDKTRQESHQFQPARLMRCPP